MSKIRSLLDRRGGKVVVVVVILYIVVFLHFSNSKFDRIFRSDDIRLPTTSHVEQLNLKKCDSQGSGISDLREQLTYAYPYDPKAKIPRRVWQTWKVGTDSTKFPSTFRKYLADWTTMVEDSFEHSLVPDDHIEPLLENLYGEVPLVLKAFKEMPATILKADFLRYLLLYARGGIYSDMDTIPLKPFDSWPSLDAEKMRGIRHGSSPIPFKNSQTPKFSEEEPGFVIGIEADPDRQDWNEWYARRIQFCQWTIQSKPGHPILRELILNITATTLYSTANTRSQFKSLVDLTNVNDYNVNYRDKRRFNDTYPHEEAKKKSNVDGTDIMNWTGPGIFSDITLEYINNLIAHNPDTLLLNANLDATTTTGEVNLKSTRKFYKKISTSLQSSSIVPWEFFSLMTKPALVDDVLVLPITAFSPDVEQMGAKSSSDEMALVKHMFEGSWKVEAENNAGH